MDTVGKRIAWAREQKEMSQMDLCRAIDIRSSTLSVLENGNGSSKFLPEIARVLGVNVEWLAYARGPRKGKAKRNERSKLEKAAPELLAALKDIRDQCRNAERIGAQGPAYFEDIEDTAVAAIKAVED
jgi:transcriptional regulator with XRE-family HTH domain